MPGAAVLEYILNPTEDGLPSIRRARATIEPIDVKASITARTTTGTIVPIDIQAEVTA